MARMMLRAGVDSDDPSPTERERRTRVLRATVEYYLPDFAKAVRRAKQMKDENGSGFIPLITQDCFAAGLHKDEYTLFGMALKYAGLYDVVVLVAPTTDEIPGVCHELRVDESGPPPTGRPTN